MTQTSLPPSLQKLSKEGGLFEGKYKLLRPLGEGSFASVLHARHEAMDRDVALKFLRTDVIKAHPEAAERFLMEVRLSSRLTSPHTVTIFDFGQTSEQIPFMVMEYVEGRPLDYAIDKYGSLGLKRSIRITLQILDSLEEAHSHRIIHRDLKPANIMVGKGMKKKKSGVHTKVLDFGVAKLVEQAEEKLKTEQGRQSTQFIGTPRYMSPEQILGQEVSPASDLYSLGLIFFEMCTGEESIPQENVAEVAQAHLAEERLALKGLDALPTVLGDIILTATARHARDRFSDVEQFRNALESALEKGKQKHKKAVSVADESMKKKAVDQEPTPSKSDVFSGAGYIALPDEEELEDVSSTPGGVAKGRLPSPAPTRKKEKKHRRKSSGASSGRKAQKSSGNLDLDMDSVQEQKRDRARKRRKMYHQKARQKRQDSSGAMQRWAGSVAVVLVAGFICFVIVGGALSLLATPMRWAMAVLPVGLAFVWAQFSENAYRDTARRIMIPWAKRTVTMVMVSILILTIVMPAEAGQSLENDALWFMAGWPDALQMEWLATSVQWICDLAAWVMGHVSSLVPWSL